MFFAVKFRAPAVGLLAGPVMLCLCSCRPHPDAGLPSLPVPTSLISSDHFLGAALSGPIAGDLPSADPASALDVRVTMVALENVPSARFTPLGSRAVFVSATGSRNAVLPAEELTRNIQVVDPKDAADSPALLRSASAGRLREIATFAGALPPGVTADFTASDPDTVFDPVTAAPTHRRLQALVVRPTNPGESPRIALVITDQLSAVPPELRTERALFDVASPTRSLTGFIVPFRFDHAASRAVGILVSISPGSIDADHVAITAEAIKQIAGHLGRPQPAVSNGQAGQNATLTAAVAELSSPTARRPSLAFLADQTHATTAEDLSLEADDTTLAQLVESAKIPTDSPSPEVIGWQLEHAALAVLSKQLDAANDGSAGAKMPDEMMAVLTTHTGEVGRHPSSLDDVLASTNSQVDLDRRLIAENTIYLEESSPASRVRAFDWLKSHGHEPLGFDPLATAKLRRQQLERAFNPPAATQPTAAQSMATPSTTAPAAGP